MKQDEAIRSLRLLADRLESAGEINGQLGVAVDIHSVRDTEELLQCLMMTTDRESVKNIGRRGVCETCELFVGGVKVFVQFETGTAGYVTREGHWVEASREATVGDLLSLHPSMQEVSQ